MEAITAALQKHGLPPVHGFYNGFGMQEAGADQVMRLWLDRGNKLANHGYGHVGINDSELATYVAEIEKNEPLLETLRPERDWFFFRYPNLHEGETLEKRNSVRAYLAGRGYRIAPVTIDSADWAFKAPYKRCMLKNDVAAVEWMKREFLEHGIQKLAQSRESGRRLFGREVPQILLLHAGAFDSQIIDEFIARYLAAGVTFITLEEALADPAYSQDSGYVSRTGRQYFDQLLDRAGLAYPPGPRLPTTQLERACR
jgi:peptidoglycan/xylan/chitin deacetylase (PgdA/CDA1 family)